ncbi:hypothetical protein C5S35_03365 [Candidatus Methanophagaceae archaeon]|nr:hypothetical protein C5S35_03365 [Methanophagales archaeon]
MNLKELIIQEAFYQNFPLEVNKFIDYCKERGVDLKWGLNGNRKYLENLEKEGLFRPIMRVEGYYANNTTDLRELYENDHVIDPRQKGFVPWANYYEKSDRYREEIVHSYYHPYQIYFLKKVLEVGLRLSPLNIPQQDNKLVKRIREREKYMISDLERLRKDSKKHEKFAELLLFIQNKYLPHVKQPGYISVTGDNYHINNLFEKLDALQKRIIPKAIVGSLGLEAEEINDYRGLIGIHGLSIDPLKNWYDLIKYIHYDKRQKLKGKALLAQDFYLISDMLALLLEDLTGEKPLETGSISDTMQGRGKVQVYGKELNYVDRDILIGFLREYGINPRPRLVLIVEGYTEQIVFPIIANAMDISLESYDIQIINILGVDRDPRELIIDYATPDVYSMDKKYYIHPERTKVFLNFDNEGNKGSWIKKLIEKPDEEIEKMMNDVLRNIKNKGGDISANTEKIFLKHTVKYHIWGQEQDDEKSEHRIREKSFEYANFSDEELSRELNKYGKKHGYNFDVTSDEIKDCRAKNRNLGKFVKEKTGTDLGKREFGEQIGNFIAKEIKERTNRFENQRKIEEILDQIIRFAVEYD